MAGISGTSPSRLAGGTFPLSVFRAAEPATHLLQVADELATNFVVLGDPTCVARSARSCNTLVATLQVAKSLKGKLSTLETHGILPLLLPNRRKIIADNVKHSKGRAQIRKEKCLCQESLPHTRRGRSLSILNSAGRTRMSILLAHFFSSLERRQ